MNERELLRKLANAFEKLSIRYFVTGGMASIAYGEPRYTSDIDVVADIPLDAVSALAAEFPAPEYYLAEHAVRDAIARRFQFNILHPTSGLKIDVILPKLNEYDQLRLSRAAVLSLSEETSAWFASPEDVILKKLVFYQEGGSEKHLRDIAAMLTIRGAQIDRSYIEEWSAKLGVSAEWDQVRHDVDEIQP